MAWWAKRLAAARGRARRGPRGAGGGGRGGGRGEGAGRRAGVGRLSAVFFSCYEGLQYCGGPHEWLGSVPRQDAGAAELLAQLESHRVQVAARAPNRLDHARSQILVQMACELQHLLCT